MSVGVEIDEFENEQPRQLIIGSVGEPTPPVVLIPPDNPDSLADIVGPVMAEKILFSQAEEMKDEIDKEVLREMYASAAKKNKHGRWASYARCKVCGYIVSGKSKKLQKISEDTWIHRGCYEIMKRKLLAEAKARVEAPVVEPKKEEVVE